jgi:hypothetical protein
LFKWYNSERNLSDSESDRGSTWEGNPVQSDQDYFRARALEEQAASKKATCDKAAMVHLELAARYVEMARAIVHFEAVMGVTETSRQQEPSSAALSKLTAFVELARPYAVAVPQHNEA